MLLFRNIAAIFMIALMTGNVCYAQDQLEGETLNTVEQKEEVNISSNVAVSPEGFDIERIPSLFLTNDELNLISDARKGLLTRRPTDSEYYSEQETGIASIPSGPRTIALGGILYVSSNEWVIWLNNQKITPKNIPPELIDVNVRKDYIRIKWFDAQTNQIFPIKLRAHERFNLDTRIFLPGVES